MSTYTTVDGPAIGYPNGNIERGYGVFIGDGFVLTAGHVAYEYNHAHDSNPSSIGAADIVTSNPSVNLNVVWDGRNYKNLYASAVVAAYTAGGNVPDNEHIEANINLVNNDMVVVSRSGGTGQNDIGLVTFIDSSIMMNPNSVLGSAVIIKREGSPTGTGTVVGNILSASGGHLTFDTPSIPGDSGGPYLLEYDGRTYVIGTQSATSATTAYGTYLTLSDWQELNELVLTSHSGNVSADEPTNLLVGSTSANALTGSGRSDIILGLEGNDDLHGEIGGASVWGNDQLYGGLGDDHFYADRGKNLFHGGDAPQSSSRAALNADGVDDASYISKTDGAIEINITNTAIDSTFSTNPDIDHAIFVKDHSSGDVDTLISVEKVKGTNSDDTLKIDDLSSNILAQSTSSGVYQGGIREIDLAGGTGDKLDLSDLGEAAIVDLSDNNPFVRSKANASLEVIVKGVEDITGTDQADDLRGNDQNNTIDGGSGNGNKLYGEGGSDKLISNGEGDTLNGGAGDELLQLKSTSATVEFGAGSGKDVVETADGEYKLKLLSLNPDDVTFIAGGEDLYLFYHEYTSYVHFSFISIKINSTGEIITFVDDDKQVGPVNYGMDWSKNGTDYAAQHSPLDSIEFNGGVTWSAQDIWSYIEDWRSHSNVKFDLMKDYGDFGLPPGGSQIGLPGEVYSLETYLDHINNTYFNVSPIAGPPPTAVTGTGGNDQLSDTPGDDTLNGLEGDDLLQAGVGSDTFVWSSGGGNDVVTDDRIAGVDTLQFGSGIAPTGLIFSVQGNDLIISFANQSGSVTLANELVSEEDGPGIDRVVFADGTSWTRAQLFDAAADAIAAALTITGTSGDDSINLPINGFTVTPGQGNDLLSVEGSGAGTIVFSKGDGHDQLDQPDLGTRNDTLLLTDILPSEVELGRSGDALTLTVVSTGDTFVVNYQFYEGVQQGLGYIHFADDTVWTRSDILAAVSEEPSASGIPYPETANAVAFDPGAMIGSAANDFIMAPSGPAGGSNGNVLSGLDGNDWMVSESWSSSMDGGVGTDVLEVRNSDLTVTGGGGSDYFVFDAGNFVGESWSLDPQYSWATITDFEDGLDKIAILNTAAGFGALTLTQAGADVEITMAGAPKIVVAQTLVSDLTADDFIVRLGGDAGTPPVGDGVVYPTPTNVVSYDSAQMDGTAANDSIFALSSSNGTSLLGRDGDDLLITESWASFVSGGAGNDVIEIRNDDVTAIGGAGYDSFVFDPAEFVGESWALDPEFVWATITGFTSGEDKLAIGSAAYEDLTISQVGDNVEISMDGAPRIILRGTSASDIDASDFIFDTDSQQMLGYADTSMPLPGGQEYLQPEMMTWFA